MPAQLTKISNLLSSRRIERPAARTWTSRPSGGHRPDFGPAV